MVIGEKEAMLSHACGAEVWRMTCGVRNVWGKLTVWESMCGTEHVWASITHVGPRSSIGRVPAFHADTPGSITSRLEDFL